MLSPMTCWACLGRSVKGGATPYLVPENQPSTTVILQVRHSTLQPSPEGTAADWDTARGTELQHASMVERRKLRGEQAASKQRTARDEAVAASRGLARTLPTCSR